MSANYLNRNKNLLHRVLEDTTYMNNLKGHWMCSRDASAIRKLYFRVLQFTQSDLIDLVRENLRKTLSSQRLNVDIQTTVDAIQGYLRANPFLADMLLGIRCRVKKRENGDTKMQESSTDNSSDDSREFYQKPQHKLTDSILVFAKACVDSDKKRYAVGFSNDEEAEESVIDYEVETKNSVFLYGLRTKRLYETREEIDCLQHHNYSEDAYDYIESLMKQVYSASKSEMNAIHNEKKAVCNAINLGDTMQFCECCFGMRGVFVDKDVQVTCRHKLCEECVHLMQMLVGRCIYCNGKFALTEQSLLIMHENLHLTLLNYLMNYGAGRCRANTANSSLPREFMFKELLLNKTNFYLLCSKVARGLYFIKHSVNDEKKFRYVRGFDRRDEYLAECIVTRYIKDNIAEPVLSSISSGNCETLVHKNLDYLWKHGDDKVKVKSNLKEGLFISLGLCDEKFILSV